MCRTGGRRCPHAGKNTDKTNVRRRQTRQFRRDMTAYAEKVGGPELAKMVRDAPAVAYPQMAALMGMSPRQISDAELSGARTHQVPDLSEFAEATEILRDAEKFAQARTGEDGYMTRADRTHLRRLQGRDAETVAEQEALAARTRASECPDPDAHAAREFTDAFRRVQDEQNGWADQNRFGPLAGVVPTRDGDRDHILMESLTSTRPEQSVAAYALLALPDREDDTEVLEEITANSDLLSPTERVAAFTSRYSDDEAGRKVLISRAAFGDPAARALVNALPRGELREAERDAVFTAAAQAYPPIPDHLRQGGPENFQHALSQKEAVGIPLAHAEVAEFARKHPDEAKKWLLDHSAHDPDYARIARAVDAGRALAEAEKEDSSVPASLRAGRERAVSEPVPSIIAPADRAAVLASRLAGGGLVHEDDVFDAARDLRPGDPASQELGRAISQADPAHRGALEDAYLEGGPAGARERARALAGEPDDLHPAPGIRPGDDVVKALRHRMDSGQPVTPADLRAAGAITGGEGFGELEAVMGKNTAEAQAAAEHFQAGARAVREGGTGDAKALVRELDELAEQKNPRAVRVATAMEGANAEVASLAARAAVADHQGESFKAQNYRRKIEGLRAQQAEIDPDTYGVPEGHAEALRHIRPNAFPAGDKARSRADFDSVRPELDAVARRIATAQSADDVMRAVSGTRSAPAELSQGDEGNVGRADQVVRALETLGYPTPKVVEGKSFVDHLGGGYDTATIRDQGVVSVPRQMGLIRDEVQSRAQERATGDVPPVTVAEAWGPVNRTSLRRFAPRDSSGRPLVLSADRLTAEQADAAVAQVWLAHSDELDSPLGTRATDPEAQKLFQQRVLGAGLTPDQKWREAVAWYDAVRASTLSAVE